MRSYILASLLHIPTSFRMILDLILRVSNVLFPYMVLSVKMSVTGNISRAIPHSFYPIRLCCLCSWDPFKKMDEEKWKKMIKKQASEYI